MSDTGNRRRKTDVPAYKARRRLDKLRRGGMDVKDIAAASGVSVASLYAILRQEKDPATGKVRKVMPHTLDLILGVELVPSAPKPKKTPDNMVDATGAYRRVRAMQADGFTLEVMSEIMGVKANTLQHQGDGTHDKVREDTYALICEGYERALLKTPEDYGVAPRTANVLRGRRRTMGDYPPRVCWDSDTIDDPKAIPEWTGRCGYEAGYRIHRREGIPLCEPCRTAHAESRWSKSGIHLDPTKLTAAREAMGWSRNRLAKELGADSASITQWERGRCSPMPDTCDALHLVLGVEYGGLLMDDEEGEW